MESNAEAYDSNKTLFALDVKPYLENFNEQLKTRYSNQDKAEQYRVYELDELESIENDPTFTESDKELIVRLKEIKQPGDRAKQLLGGIENFFNSIVNEAKSESPLTASEPRAKLRRTAAILYKNAQIPEMNISRGSFKEVAGPLGVDQKFLRPTTQLIIENIGPIWRWEGNIPDLSDKTPNSKKSRQVSFITNNPRSSISQEATTKLIAIEVEDIIYLNNKLNNPSYLPRIYQETKRGRYIESIPLDFPNGEIKTRLNDIVSVASSLVEMWKDLGVILTDIKDTNLRKRNNGDVVITDSGGKVGVGAGAVEFDSIKLARRGEEGKLVYTIDHSPIFTPPEFANLLSGEEVDTIKTEPFMVYQLGILLFQSLYKEYEWNESISSYHGFNWLDPARDSYPVCTINSDTVADLLQRYPEKDIPTAVTNLLMSMLSTVPDKRPDIKEVVRTLQSIVKEMETVKTPELSI